MNNLISYTFKNNNIRTLLKDNAPWFVATDIAKALDYRNAPDAVRTLDNDEKDTHIMRTIKGNQELTIINESGMYSLILRSRKPEAKAFKKFVTSEVLPSIRKTGAYVTPKQGELGLVPVKEYTRRLPSGKKEIVLSEKARSEIGGIVKSCVGVAIRDALKTFFVESPQVSEKIGQFKNETERNLYMAIKAYGDERERNGLIKALREYKTYFEVADILKQSTPIQISAK